MEIVVLSCLLLYVKLYILVSPSYKAAAVTYKVVNDDIVAP